MRVPHVDDHVRLKSDVPELFLSRGERGVICSTWFWPTLRYDVEFTSAGCDQQTRALLSADQVEIDEREEDEAMAQA